MSVRELSGERLVDRPRSMLSALWHDEAVRAGLIVFVVLRLVTAIAAFVLVTTNPVPKPSWLHYDPLNPHPNESGETYDQALLPDAPFYALIQAWHRYDTAWYVKISIQGYKADSAIVFPPLYPILVRLVAPFSGSTVMASLVVSNMACLIALILLFKLVMVEFNDRGLAWRTLIGLAIFPTAYYLVAGYTESLYLALTLGAWLAVLQKRWWLTGLLAGLASLVRLQGVILCLPLFWIAYVQFRPRSQGLLPILQRLPAVIGGAVGAGIYIAYLTINQLGSMEYYFESQWQLYTRWPWTSVITYVNRWLAHRTFDFENDNAFALVLMVALGLFVLLKMRPSYSLYVFGTIGAILLRFHDVGPDHGAQFESMIRYSLLLFPCFIALGMILTQRGLLLVYSVLIAVAAYLMHVHDIGLTHGVQIENVIYYALLLLPILLAAWILLVRRWSVLVYAVVLLPWGFFLLYRFTHWIWVA